MLHIQKALLLPTSFLFSSPAPGFESSFCSQALVPLGPGGSCIPTRWSRRLLVASPPFICLLCFPKAHRHLTSFFKAVSSSRSSPRSRAAISLPPSDTHTLTHAQKELGLESGKETNSFPSSRFFCSTLFDKHPGACP